jgi:hypothetical protein
MKETNQPLANSKSVHPAFAELHGKRSLWISSGNLGSEGGSQLVRHLGETIVPSLLHDGGCALSIDRAHYIALLECWQQGPSSVARTLSHREILCAGTFAQGEAVADPWIVGRHVPLENINCICQELNCIFNAGELSQSPRARTLLIRDLAATFVRASFRSQLNLRSVSRGPTPPLRWPAGATA